ncbi:MAG: hypothetical protein ACI31R_04800 [Bacilli bacterium]
MKVKNISEKKLSFLDKLKLPSDILNTESEIFIFESKDKWDKNEKVFKKLYIDEGEVFGNKLYIINEEINKKEDIDIEELIIPEELISIKGKISGFTMPYIDNINLKTILGSCEFTVKEKISYLKQVGEILEKMKKVRLYKNVPNFYLNDLHSSNFILNKNTDRINVIDMDSARIGNSLSAPSKYLNKKSFISEVPKYKKINNNIGGFYEADENTDLYCYTLMILEYLYGDGIDKLSIGDYYIYMEYLSSLGASKEILDKFSLIYSNKDNENPYEYLDLLEEIYGKTSKYAFKNVRKKMFF